MESVPSTTRLSHDQIEDLLAGKTITFRTMDGQLVNIQGHCKPDPVLVASVEKPKNPLATHEKVELFNALFSGRTDVFATRWENQAGKSGYSPACDKNLTEKSASRCMTSMAEFYPRP